MSTYSTFQSLTNLEDCSLQWKCKPWRLYSYWHRAGQIPKWRRVVKEALHSILTNLSNHVGGIDFDFYASLIKSCYVIPYTRAMMDSKVSIIPMNLNNPESRSKKYCINNDDDKHGSSKAPNHIFIRFQPTMTTVRVTIWFILKQGSHTYHQ